MKDSDWHKYKQCSLRTYMFVNKFMQTVQKNINFCKFLRSINFYHEVFRIENVAATYSCLDYVTPYNNGFSKVQQSK